MEKRDYYEVLGVERAADGAAIKTAYRKLAHQFHPDKNPGSKDAEERFKEASEAYEVLSDPDKRARYDRSVTRNGPQFQDFGFGGAAPRINDIFGDIFGEMFGGGARRTRARTRGSDLRYHLELAVRGGGLRHDRPDHHPAPEAVRHLQGHRARSRGPVPAPARPAAVPARSGSPRASSPSPGPATTARGRGASSSTSARTAAAPARRASRRTWR